MTQLSDNLESMSIQRKSNSLRPFGVTSDVFPRTVTILAFGLALQSCCPLSNYDPDPAKRTYFDFAMGPDNGDFTNQLKSLGEPSLSVLPNSSCASVYRFLWIRTFHNPISIRVEHHKDNTTKVYAKELGKTGPGQPKTLIKDRDLDWSATQYASFISKVDKMDFWNSPSVLIITERELCADGASWTLEGVDQNRCHFIKRGPATIDKNPALKEVGLFLLRDTKLLPPKEQIY